MDHFTLPEGGTRILVPNTTTEEYTTGDGGFLGYPGRQGWSQEDILGENTFGERSAEDVQAFFQTWLYFGCVIEVLKVPKVECSTTDFLDPDKKYVSTTRLPSKIRKWKRKIQRMKDQKRERRLEKYLKEVNAILTVLSKFVNYYCGTAGLPRLDTQLVKSKRMDWPVSEEVSMSIIALGYTLNQAMLTFHGIVRTKNRWGYSTLLKSRMLDAGWCPMDVRRSLTDMGIDGHYYIAAFPNLQAKPNSAGKRLHDDCTEDRCVAQDIDEKTYVTQHAEHGCNCDNVLVDIHHVVKIIEEGGTPVVTWHEANKELHVETFDEVKSSLTPYISISHV